MIRKIRLEFLSVPALLASLLLAWQAYVSIFHVSDFILPPPTAVLNAFVELLASASTWMHLRVTVLQVLGGFAIASITAIAVGLLVGRVGWLERTLSPFVVAAQTVPKIALVPILIIWFGFGHESKLLTAAIMAFFPVFAAAVHGVKSVANGHRAVMKALNAGLWHRLRYLEFPSALPVIFTGLEIGMVLATIGCLVAQFIGGNTGLGYLLIAKMNAYETDAMFAVILLLVIMGLTFNLLIRLMRRVLIPWHVSVEH